ncbi:MAG: indolepyruvate oxidoreductase subunit beta [Candidatus Fimadaptatus sp.]
MSSILLCGVGGQGTVLASRILAQAAMNRGMFARTAETIGMAQRGGCVVSHVRFGEGVYSSLIPQGSADVIIASEPCEAARNLGYLRSGGLVVTSPDAIQPVTASLSGKRFEGAAMIDYLRRHARVLTVDTAELKRRTGSIKGLNIALIGCALEAESVGITADDVDGAIRQKVNPRFLDMNMAALMLGRECARKT